MSDIITAARRTVSEYSRADLLSSVSPETDRHIVCFYRDAAIFAESICDLAGRTLAAGGVTVLIATAPHLGLIEKPLVRVGFDLERLRAIGRYVALYAQNILTLLRAYLQS